VDMRAGRGGWGIGVSGILMINAGYRECKLAEVFQK